MHAYTKTARAILAFVCCFAAAPAMASHLIGDEFAYQYLGDVSVGGVIMHKYRVTLNLYADCLTGEPIAIAEDNPAFFAAYNGITLLSADSVAFTSSVSVPVTSFGSCGTGGAPLCVIKKTFTKDYTLPSSSSAFTIVYQRCCKNGSLTNVADPANAGSTYYCTIPPTAVAASNNSAVFNAYPPMEIATGYPFSADLSATDADGDSLSYELCMPYNGGDGVNTKPFPPLPPPFDPVDYVSPLSYSNPMNCSVALAIDPATGILSGTPNIIGRYLIAVCCKEWRGGVLINTNRREFEMLVTTFTGGSYHPDAGADTFIYAGDSLQFNGAGAATYSWSPGTYLSSTSIPNPVGNFPVAGTFSYVLHGISDSGCTGDDTIVVTVLEHSEFTAPNAFTPNNDGLNDIFTPIPIKSSVLLGLKVYNKTGLLLYAGSGNNAGWDGSYHGVQQEIGVYFYQIVYSDNNGAIRTTSGTVTLIR